MEPFITFEIELNGFCNSAVSSVVEEQKQENRPFRCWVAQDVVDTHVKMWMDIEQPTSRECEK